MQNTIYMDGLGKQTVCFLRFLWFHNKTVTEGRELDLHLDSLRVLRFGTALQGFGGTLLGGGHPGQ